MYHARTSAVEVLSHSTPWTGSDTRLVLVALAAIVVVVVLIAAFRVHPMIALVSGALVAGLGAGLGTASIVSDFKTGAGHTLGGTGIVIALGAMLGGLLADSGGAQVLADSILRRTGARSLPWAMMGVAMIIGLPLFFEVGLVIMVPIIVAMSKQSGVRLMSVAVPALAGMTTLHALVPPHPGPIVAVDTLHASFGLTILLGIAIAIPVAVVAGPVYGALIAKHIEPLPAEEGGWEDLVSGDGPTDRPGLTVTLVTMLLPVLLMLAGGVGAALNQDSAPAKVLDFIGNPIVALLVSVLVAMVTFGYLRGRSRQQVDHVVRRGLIPVVSLIMIIGAGGGLTGVLVGAGIGRTLSSAAANLHISILVLAWIVAVLLRQASGSATVATTTAAGLMAPLAHGLSSTHLALLALAMGSGSVFFCHVNDAGFWMVKEFFSLRLKDTFKTWSAIQTIVSVTSFGLIMLLSAVI